jgi:head-tail adaptor
VTDDIAEMQQRDLSITVDGEDQISELWRLDLSDKEWEPIQGSSMVEMEMERYEVSVLREIQYWPPCCDISDE